ncbi:hypothetical protein [Catelliglobosispora koreensis]|uniref:hypothetical protein n=1 Tax=Catelliglobosispora koreensis TaxID=129052 RepID=UPI000380E2A2|nr:hypothetical protein [Catelliglobosispora koreensis]
MWNALAALAAVAAALIAIMVGKRTIRAQTRSTLDQRAPDVSVVLNRVEPILRTRLANGEWGVEHSSWEDGRFVKPWCLAKPGGQPSPPAPLHPAEGRDEGDLSWAAFLSVTIHNHSSRTVYMDSDDLVVSGSNSYGQRLPTAKAVGRLVLGPDQQERFYLPVVKSVREWASLYGSDRWEAATSIMVDDGQDFGVSEERVINIRLRPVEPSNAGADFQGVQHCQGCGKPLWVMRSTDFGEATVEPAVRRYFYSKIAGQQVPSDRPGWPTRIARRFVRRRG